MDEINSTHLSLCGLCGKLVKSNSKAVGCDGQCAKWYHKTCLKMGNQKYKFLGKNNDILWMCHNCLSNPNFEPYSYDLNIDNGILNKNDVTMIDCSYTSNSFLHYNLDPWVSFNLHNSPSYYYDQNSPFFLSGTFPKYKNDYFSNMLR